MHDVIIGETIKYWNESHNIMYTDKSHIYVRY